MVDGIMVVEGRLRILDIGRRGRESTENGGILGNERFPRNLISGCRRREGEGRIWGEGVEMWW